jgi:ectoine hydroxylase-related dioxygenase (phytanoyl-CoA dioxygenase family)
MADKGQPEALSQFGAAFDYPGVLRLAEHPRVLPLAVNLLGYNLQLHLSSLNVKRPIARGQGSAYDGGQVRGANNASINWHRDGPSPQFPRVGDHSIKFCFILSDLTQPGRGNTKVIPGSHRDPAYRPPHADAGEPVPGEVQICGAPGDVMVFSQNLWHAATFNRSAIERRLAFVGYSACWMRPVDYSVAPAHLLEAASPHLRQLLGNVGPASYNHYMDADLPLKALWLGEDAVDCYA